MIPTCGRAELANLLDRLGSIGSVETGAAWGKAIELASFVGYFEVVPSAIPESRRGEGRLPGGDTGPAAGEPGAPSAAEEAAARTLGTSETEPRAKLIQVTAVHHTTDTERERRAEEPSFQAPWEGREYRSSLAYPASEPLVPWPRLWRHLRAQLSHPRPTHEVDVPRLEERLCRVEPIVTVPRLSRAHLEVRPRLLIDAASRNMPFWFDQDYASAQLRRWLARTVEEPLVCLQGVAPLRWLEREARRCSTSPWAARTVLLLGDLGAYGGPRDRRAWREAGEWLLERGAVLRALCPCPAWRLDPGLARLWNAAPWDARERAALPLSPEELAGRAEALLSLVSPANRVELGLLRAARGLLPPGSTDSGTEVDAVQHPAVMGRSSVALTLDAERQKALRKAFTEAPGSEALHARMVELLREWHEKLPEEILTTELFELALLRQELFEPGPSESDRVEPGRAQSGRAEPGDRPRELLELRRFMLAVAHAMDRAESSADSSRSLPGGVKAWFKELTARLPREAWLGEDAELWASLRRAWVVAHRGDTSAAAPPGLKPEELTEPTQRHSPQRWRLWQHGPGFVVLPASTAGSVGAPEPHPGTEASRVGSPVAEFMAGKPELYVAARGREAERYPLPPRADAPITFPVAPDAALEWQLTTDKEQLTLGTLEKPAWAKRAGRDRYGLYADFEYRGVVQRMRWIPPGRFLMGSPETEAERYSDERQHEVTLTRGYWLADTACTQALWTAVMGKNPSRFKEEPASPEHPVEQVSWDDCQAFLKQLNARVVGLELRLPTEAEWEYACRAGTTGPFSFGEVLTPELANYRGDYPYANQATGKYRQKTVPVKELSPNPWGLYQVHGNVLEWCEDRYGLYSGIAEVDPRGALSGQYRVLRGGSWHYYGRRVRSAYRDRYGHGDRDVHVGFRLARGQEPEPVEQASPRRRQ